MKKHILSLFLCISTFSSFATHLMGGDLAVRNIGTGIYDLRLTEYRDSFGVYFYNIESIHQYSFDNVTNAYQYNTTHVLNLNNVLSTGMITNFPYGVEVGLYNDTLTLLPGKYRFILNSCCRNDQIANMPNAYAENLTLYADIRVDVLGNNSTPDFLTMPIANFTINEPATYSPLPYDIDGDSLAWALNVPYTNADTLIGDLIATAQGFSSPASNSFGPFTMNAVNGEITWTPNQVGKWVQSFIVNEYRDGEKIGSVSRDFQYVVVSDQMFTNTSVPDFTVNDNRIIYEPNNNFSWLKYQPDQPLTFEIGGTDLDAGATLELQSYSEIFLLANDPAVFSVVNNGNNITGTLNWTPDATFSKDVILVFRLRDGMWSKDYTLLLTKNNNTSIGTTPSAIANVAVYPNPASTTLNIAVDLAKDMTGDIAMYSAIGQKVATLQAGKLAKGNHQFNQNISVASGMYYVVVRNGNQIVKTIPVAVK